MSNEIDFKKLCELSKLDIHEEMIKETSIKVRDVMTLFDKLDELEISNIDNTEVNENLRQEKSLDSIRDDIPRDKSRFDPTSKICFLNTKNGFVLGPRI